ARYREPVLDPSLPLVRQWRSLHPGGKVVGCFPVYSPAELIHAAGMLPVGLWGGGNKIEMDHADSLFQSFICSIVKSTMELGLTGQLDVVDAVLFQNICDSARNLATVFQRNLPELFVEYLHLPQDLESPLAEGYLRAELARLRAGLEVLAGQRVRDEALWASIELYDRIRTVLRSVEDLRIRRPQDMPCTDLYVLTRAISVLPPEEALPLLEMALESAAGCEARPRDRLRVVLEGCFCEQPPLELIQILEEAGCYIVGDDFHLGWRWFVEALPLETDPVLAMARSFIHRSVHCSVKHDTRENKAIHLLQKVKLTRAQGVLIMAAKFCEPALLDYPLLRKALEQEGIPHLFLEFEEKMWAFERIRSEVETFVESLLLD
ncbi:MAG: 2-hydroxyacyl-CoA dehydratase, partial [Thermodesulfobacteriota bacterium]